MDEKKVDQLVLATITADKRVSLLKDADDGSFAVMITVYDHKDDRRSHIVAFGIGEFDDAMLIYDRHAKLMAHEISCKMKGE